MCGKDRMVALSLLCYAGSPPHVRERLVLLRLHKDRQGITPACAGKTLGVSTSKPDGEDHPRMCGKDILSENRLLIALGSPPHVRERRWNIQRLHLRTRITPACAGKTF